MATVHTEVVNFPIDLNDAAYVCMMYPHFTTKLEVAKVIREYLTLYGLGWRDAMENEHNPEGYGTGPDDYAQACRLFGIETGSA